MVIASWSIGIFFGEDHVFFGYAVNISFASGHKLPLIIIDSQFGSIILQNRWLVIFEVDAVGKESDLVIAFVFFICLQQVTLHGRANTWTVGKEEIGHIDLVLEKILGQVCAILV